MRTGSIIYALGLVSYLALYLGIVRLLFLSLFKNMRSSRLLFSFILSCVLQVVSILLTCSLSLAANNYQTMKYDWYCFPNMFWTLGEIFPDGASVAWATLQHYEGLAFLYGSALFVMVVNLALAAKDVVLVRIETPDRVRKERDKFRSPSTSQADLLPEDPLAS